MRRIVPALLLGVSAALAQPEIAPGGLVTFRLTAPRASEVTLTGEFITGAKPLEKDKMGVWSVTVGPIEPEIYNYNFTIDGVKTIDPANPNVKTGSTPSTIASILDVPAAAPRFFDGQPVPHGEIHTHWYHSKSLGAMRRLTVYTPPNYAARTRARYPVLYLLHGANADETAWTRLGRANLILDNLAASGEALPFVVVMPFGYGIPPGTPRPAGSGAADNTSLFTRDLLEDVIPMIESKYRVQADRAHRAIAGLSMGGGESLGIGLNHPELFAWVAGFSAALRPDNFATAFPKVGNAGAQLKLLWVGCGTEDSLFAASRRFSDFLKQHGVQHVFHESAGAHTWIVWRRYLNELAPILFR